MTTNERETMTSENESGGGRMDRGFSSDPAKTKCYRVWAGESAVLVDANSLKEARINGANMLGTHRITRVEQLDS